MSSGSKAHIYETEGRPLLTFTRTDVSGTHGATYVYNQTYGLVAIGYIDVQGNKYMFY